MKQKEAEIRASSKNVSRNIATRLKIFAACVLLAMSLSTSIKADSLFVTIGADSLHFSTIFNAKFYGSTCGDFLDGFRESWTPDYFCDPKPGPPEVNHTKGWKWAHFRILSADGSCMLFDGLLEPTTNIEGDQQLEMSIPINETLTSSSFTFDNTSYYVKFTPRTWSVPGFQVERGKSYVFHISGLTNGGCSGDPDGEKTESDEPLVALPCQTDDCCVVAGDANHDGVFSILDVTYLVDYFIRKTGPPPDCLGEGDANGDCSFAEDDLDYMIASIFTGGPDPVCPSP